MDSEIHDTVHDLATSIRKKFEELPPLSPKCCIYRIPRNLRGKNKSAYTPCLISIGPFHHNKKSLQNMQEHKFRYLQSFLERNEKRKLIDYLTQIRQWEKEIRDCYVEKIELSSKEFNEMVLLDGCFLIEFFLVWFLDKADDTDCIFKKPSIEVAILRDILLLENQLPFFVLEGLYKIAFGDDNDDELVSDQQKNLESATDYDDDDGMSSMPSFLDLCCQVFVEKVEVLEKFKDRQVLHLVDFLRASYLPSILRDQIESSSDDLELPPGVERLHDSGIKFEVAKDKSLLDIEFCDGVLRIPRLEMEDYTEPMLLNLSAFEQCHYHYESYIVDYVVFMDTIITTVKDVDILMSEGIMMNFLGNTEDLADIFNTICRGTTYQEKGFYYSNLCKQLNAHYKTPWHRWRAMLKHDYFSNCCCCITHSYCHTNCLYYHFYEMKRSIITIYVCWIGGYINWLKIETHASNYLVEGCLMMKK